MKPLDEVIQDLKNMRGTQVLFKKRYHLEWETAEIDFVISKLVDLNSELFTQAQLDKAERAAYEKGVRYGLKN